jgi:hypothetical protein
LGTRLPLWVGCRRSPGKVSSRDQPAAANVGSRPRPAAQGPLAERLVYAGSGRWGPSARQTGLAAMRSPAEAAAILRGFHKADVALQSASDNSPLVPGYDAACLERQKPTHSRSRGITQIDPLHRRQFRYLHSCSDCFRLEENRRVRISPTEITLLSRRTEILALVYRRRIYSVPDSLSKSIGVNFVTHLMYEVVSKPSGNSGLMPSHSSFENLASPLNPVLKRFLNRTVVTFPSPRISTELLSPLSDPPRHNSNTDSRTIRTSCSLIAQAQSGNKKPINAIKA